MGFAQKHLSEAQLIDIATSLFKITSKDMNKGELHGLCPIHGEKNPSFSYNFKKDQYKCLSCNADGDLIRLWSEVNHYGQKDGFKEFCTKYGIATKDTERHPLSSPGGLDSSTPCESNPPPSSGDLSHELIVEQMNRAWEKFSALPAGMVARLEKERGWTKKWIDILDLRLETWRLSKKGELYAVKEPVKIAIPIRNIAGELINIRLYQPGGGRYKIMPFAKTVGSSALFPACTIDKDANILLCEGESDTVCAISHGLNAITQTAKLKNWPKGHLEPFKGRDVVIAYDADEPGQKYAKFAADALLGCAKSVRLIQWPAFMGKDETGAIPKDHGQDLTDFFVRHGKSADDLRALIDAAAPWPPASIQITSQKSEPPLDNKDIPEDSVENTMDVLQFFDHGALKRYSFRPRLLAEKLLQEDPLMTDPSTDLVYRWNGKYWEGYEESHLKKKAVLLLRVEAKKGWIEDAIFQVKMLSTLPTGRKVNDRVDWINLKSGMLNIKTFEMIPHDREYYFTQMLPIDFDPNSEKKCDNFLKFLETNLKTKEVIEQVQEFTGYCLVRHAKYEKALYLIGPGADGKSTYMKLLRELVGPENCSAVSFGAIEDQFQRAAMYNRLVNLSAEIGAESLESQYFKKIVSGDTLQAAYKHVDTFEFDPFCKLVFAGNMLPRVRDNTDGYFRKLLIVQMKRQFMEDDPDRDPNLFDKLKEELSEIFYWALCGLARLVKQGHFTFCDETRELMQDYRRLNNPVLCYVEEECDMGEELEVSKKDLYSDYKNYCNRNGYSALHSGNFFRELNTVFRNLRSYRPRKDNPDRLPYVQGIKIKAVLT